MQANNVHIWDKGEFSRRVEKRIVLLNAHSVL